MKPVFAFLMALFLFSSCTKTDNAENTGNTADGGQVNVSALTSRFIGAWNAKQADSVAAMIADDAHFLQGDVHYSGKSQIVRNWVDKTMPTINNLRTSMLSSTTDTETAYEAGTFTVDVPAQTANDPNATGAGNYMLLWKKKDGKWKLSYAQLENHNLQVKQ